jgi:hypothetical protein
VLSEIIEANGHTTAAGMLNLSLNVGLSNAAVAVLVRVRPLAAAGEVDANGWPHDFFECLAGSMPEGWRPAQGYFEERVPLAVVFCPIRMPASPGCGNGTRA